MQISLRKLIWSIIGLFVLYNGSIAAYKIYQIRGTTPAVIPAPFLTAVEQVCFMVLGGAVLIGGLIIFLWLMNGGDDADVKVSIPKIKGRKSEDAPQAPEGWDPLNKDNRTYEKFD